MGAGHARRCVPGLWTPEAALIGVQGCLLVWRTWLTDYISRIEARAGRHLIAQVDFATNETAICWLLASVVVLPYHMQDKHVFTLHKHCRALNDASNLAAM